MNKTLVEIEACVINMNGIADNTIDALAVQNEQIKGIANNTASMDDNLTHTSYLLSWYGRKTTKQKYLLAITLILLLTIIGIVAYWIYKSSHS